MSSYRSVVATAAMSLLPLTACSTPSTDGLQVVTSFYPLAFVADRVAGDHAEVVNLTQPGQEPHDLELSPVQVAQVANAALVVYESTLQASVTAAVDQAPGVPTIDAAVVADLMTSDDEHDDHDDHDDHGESDSDDHDHGDLDPHFWLDPVRMTIVADAVAAELGAIDPDNAEAYSANADDLRDELAQLDQDYVDALASCQRYDIVVSHDAFSYLTKYGLQIHAIAGLSPDAEPTPADLAELTELVTTAGITTIFTEPLVAADLADTLAADTGLTTAVLDPIEGLSDQTADENYVSLMRANLAALKEANQCQ